MAEESRQELYKPVLMESYASPPRFLQKVSMCLLRASYPALVFWFELLVVELSDNTFPGLGPFGGGIGSATSNGGNEGGGGSAIGGGSDRSGGEPSFGNGDGSGRSDNTIPGLVRLYFAHQ
ncbi:hypothetical protein DKX38_022999 [Salix brachista]|uniref:Uncharacterized protein n=1 Tax=Salix brachista TaxID=2182728 RepID=A0A5N5K634_9ROSI|nr:hypothetical protein DKX38_022999 [Salix brachista]